MHRAVIFGAADIKDYQNVLGYISGDDYIICADGGYMHAKKLGITPDVVIGDFDSYTQDDFDPASKIIKAERKKDQTDTELAIIFAQKNNIDDIILFGCMHGRFDHMFANIWLLLRYESTGIHITMIGDGDIIMVSSGHTILPKADNCYISLYAISDSVKDLTLKGLLYPLEGYELNRGDIIGTSNEFVDDVAEISFSKGELLIIISNRRE